MRPPVPAVVIACLLAPPPGRAQDPPADLLAAARERLLAGDVAGALVEAERLGRESPEECRDLGCAYLAGQLALRAGDRKAAGEALSRAVAAGGPLLDRAALGLAEIRERAAPGEALKLVADPARRWAGTPLAERARLVELSARLRLGEVEEVERELRRLRRSDRRDAGLRLLEVAIEAGNARWARRHARSLLVERSNDRAAHVAALYLAGGGTGDLGPEERWGLANALYVGRSFNRAIQELDRVAREGPPVRAREARFLVGRAALKAGNDGLAAATFRSLASGSDRLAERSLYQLGVVALRCGDRDGALGRFEEAALRSSPRSAVGPQAREQQVRIHLGDGDLDSARDVLALARDAYGLASEGVARMAVLVAVQDIRRGAHGTALGCLEGLAPRDREARELVGYFRASALRGLGRPEEAAEELRPVAEHGSFLGRLAREALRDLARPETASVVEAARRALGSGRAREAMSAAAAALAAGGGEAAEALLCSAYRIDPLYGAVYRLEDAPRAAQAGTAGALLSALGLDAEAAEERSTRPRKDLQDVHDVAVLAARGGDPERALAWAERVVSRLPRDFERACLPRGVRRLLYPEAWGDELVALAQASGTDPDLVRAVMRTESRFDRLAFSPAGAHGLMQFLPETARRVGAWLGLPQVGSDDLLVPRMSIRLGAAYLSELVRLFGGRVEPAIAAYNAGEEQAFAWASHLGRSGLPALLAAIEFQETRNYLGRVLLSLEAYRELSRSGTPPEASL